MKPVIAPTAYLLISHGSRDPRPQEAMDRLADLVRKRLEAKLHSPGANESCAAHLPQSDSSHQSFHSGLDTTPANEKMTGSTSTLARPTLSSRRSQSGELFREPSPRKLCSEVIVGTACLELSPLPLHEQIYEFGLRLKAAGVTELKLLPVFLMSGVHVMEDIPAEVETAKAKLGDTLRLSLCSHLGSHPEMTQVLTNRLATASAQGTLLVAHGSRRPKGNQAIQALSKQVGTPVAYWATAPDIEAQVVNLMQQGYQRLAILPYFLFAGGITDAIAHRTEELAERFPKVTFRLLPMLGATEEVAQMAADLVR